MKKECKFCDIKVNEIIGITCGALLLRGNNTVVRFLGGKFYLSDNVSFPDIEIYYCPVCGRKLR